MWTAQNIFNRSTAFRSKTDVKLLPHLRTGKSKGTVSFRKWSLYLQVPFKNANHSHVDFIIICLEITVVKGGGDVFEEEEEEEEEKVEEGKQ